jgi:predicted PurR-regulated permease PerM
MPTTEENKRTPPPSAATREAGPPGGPLLPPGTVPGHFIRRRSDRAILGSLLALAALGFLTLCYFASSVFITIISSILIAFALEPVVQLLGRKAGIGRLLASAIVVFLAVGVLYAILYMAYGSAQLLFTDLPILIEQIRRAPLVQSLTRQFFGLTESIQEAGRTIALTAPPPPPKETAIIVRDSATWTQAILRGVGSLGTVLFSLSFIPFLVYFLLAEKEKLIRRTRTLFAEEHHETMMATVARIETMMQKFLTGNAIVAGILSVLTALLFLLVGLRYWLVLGIVSGVVSTIPYLGLLLALLPPLVVGLITFESGVPVVIIAASISAFHVVAVNFLMPKLVGGGVQLNPVAATVSIMFFGWMWGGMGLILGIPIVAVMKCVLENMEPTRKIGRWLGD